jgi:hypothetical protein
MPMRPHEHVVQLYGSDDRLLAQNASRYLHEGFARGDGLLLIAAASHIDAIVSGLAERGLDVPRNVREGRLVAIDAQAMLDQITIDGMPDAQCFADVVGRTLRTIRRRTGASEVSAYGEMVGILWTAGKAAAAERLESLWNTLMAEAGLRLFCAYPIDVLGHGCNPEALAPVLAAHTAVVPAGGNLGAALARAARDILGDGADDLLRRLESALPAGIPAAEALAAGLQDGRQGRAREILDRARYYQDFLPQPAA